MSLERLQIITTAGDLIRARTRGMVQNLTIELKEDRVILKGKSKTFWGKQLATQAALSVLRDEFGFSLVNDIEVLDFRAESVL